MRKLIKDLRITVCLLSSVIMIITNTGLDVYAEEIMQSVDDETVMEESTEVESEEGAFDSENEEWNIEMFVKETEAEEATDEKTEIIESIIAETESVEFITEKSFEETQEETKLFSETSTEPIQTEEETVQVEETSTEIIQTEEMITETIQLEETLSVEDESDTQIIEDKNLLTDEIIAGDTYNNITWVIDADRKLTVTGSGDFAEDENRAVSRAPWYQWRGQINTAEVRTTGMTNVSYMFYDCKRLMEVDLSGCDGSQLVNMSHIFSGCTNLTNVNLSGFDTSNIRDMSSMFGGCSSLASIDVNDFDTSNVTNMYSIFSGCSNLTNLDISSFDTSNVTDMSEMFSHCDKLTSLDVSMLDTSHVIDMRAMFDGCKNLTSINVSGFDTCNVKDMSALFRDCGNLTSVDVSCFDTGKVNDMSSMFSHCKKLTSVDVSGFDTSNVTDMSGMFSNCIKLTSIDVRGFDTSNVTDMSYMFYMTSYPWMQSDEISLLSAVDVSHFDTRNVTNMEGMFGGCINITNLDIRNFDTSKVTSIYQMFRDCFGLTSLDVSHFDTGNVTNMLSTFIGCKNLEELDVSSFDTSKVTDMSYMFADCYNLKQLDLSNFNTSNVTEMARMFDNCESLTNVDLSSFDVKNVKSIGGIFRNCNALEKVDLSSFDFGKINLESLFTDCTSLIQIQTPLNVSASIDLPSGTWYDSNENEYTKLPNLPYSILLTKDSKPAEVEERIAATKQKTTYRQGAKVDVEDLTVRYYKSDGTVVSLKAEEYTTNVNSIVTSTLGKTSLIIEYKDFTATLTLTVVPATKKVVQISGIEAWNSTFNKRPAFYTNNVKVEADGIDVTDKVVLMYHYTGTQADGSAYESLTEGPINAGNYVLTVSVADETEEYTGSETYYYTIKKAPIKIMVRDMELEVNEELPKIEDYKYDVAGLIEGDRLETYPLIKCDITDTSVPSTYEIQAEGASAGMNYEITYQSGTLTVRKTGEEEIYYTVTFNLSGKGSDIKQINIKQNSIITPPADPTAEGFTFTGWYKEQTCITKWNFTTDQITSDLTLYAGWKAKDDNKNDDNKDDDNKDDSNKDDDNKDDDNNDKDDDNSKDDSSYPIAERQDLSTLNASIAGIRTQTYNRDEQEPAVKVTAFVNGKKTTLIEGMDYRVSYKNNIDAGTATITIKGNGVYKGSLTQNFTIRPKAVKKLKVVAGALSENASGSDLSSYPIHVYDGAKRLNLGTDYTLSSTGVTKNAAKVSITGKGNYTGTMTAKLSVYSVSSDHIINLDHVRLDKDTAAYTGKPVKTVNPIVTVSGSTLTLNQDYKVQYQNNTNAGTAYVIVTGKGAYRGRVVLPFEIQPVSASAGGVTIKPISAKTYNGKLQKPAVSVTASTGGKTKKLVKNKDYKVTYKNNLHAGTATVIITGKGNYAGMKVQTQFTIQPQNIAKAAVKGTQSSLQLTYNKRLLKQGVHYEAPSYGGSTKNKVQVTIKGKGDFTGQITKYIKQ